MLVILGHPRARSLCGALADAYAGGAREADCAVRRLDLAALDFDPDLHTVSPNAQGFESDLLRACTLILWAEHLVFVYPTWWGTMPALLKAFLDRALTPDFAFRTCEGGTGYQGLLGGRSAQLITTMDTPPLVHRLAYRQPGRNAMARATLGFCGIRAVRCMVCGPVRGSSAPRRAAWIERARSAGRALARGRITPTEVLRHKAAVWRAAMRLQFYPMTWLAYAVGALAASPAGSVLDDRLFWLGYLCLFLLEVAAVFVNEIADFESDRNNRFFGPFTGGSRVLVDGVLTRQDLQRGIAVTLAAFVAATAVLLALAPHAWAAAALMATMGLLAIGYTAPPLKLSYRGVGELDVALTHSIGVMLCGYVFMGGAWNDALPWVMSLPLLLAIVPSITLSGIPDREADAAAGKGTLAVRLGQRGALTLALVFTLLAASSALIWQLTGLASGAYAGSAYVIVPHALWLSSRLVARRESAQPPGRIDALMIASLTYVLWFALVPLFHLTR